MPLVGALVTSKKNLGLILLNLNEEFFFSLSYWCYKFKTNSICSVSLGQLGMI